MAETFFYMRTAGNSQQGPFSFSQLVRLREKNLLPPDVLLSADLITWKNASEFFQSEQTESSATAAPSRNMESTAPQNVEYPGSMPEPGEIAATSPVYTTFGFCWNAPTNLNRLLAVEEKCTGNRVLTGVCGVATTLILFLFFTTFVFAVVQTSAWCGALMITTAALFTAGVLLLLLENLCLARYARLKTDRVYLFLMMQIFCVTTVVFTAGFPLFGLYLANGPVWLWYLIPGFSGAVLIAGTVNLILGCVCGYRRIFRFGKAATAALTFLFTLQWLAVFPAGYFLFEQIQKINI